MIGVEVLNHKPNGYVSHRLNNDQRRMLPLPKEEGFRYCKAAASQQAMQLVGLYQTIGP
jgi:hypothetical protein